VGAYYPQGFSPTKMYVSERIRAGSALAHRLYESSRQLRGEPYAANDCHQYGLIHKLCGWTPSKRKYVEEVGHPAIFSFNRRWIDYTALAGSIFTRCHPQFCYQISWLFRNKRLQKERYLLDEVINGSWKRKPWKKLLPRERQRLSPRWDQFYFRGKEYLIQWRKTGALAEKLYNEILQIQYGFKEDPFGWRVRIMDGKKA